MDANIFCNTGMGGSCIHAISGQGFVKWNRIASVKTGPAEVIFRIFDAGGCQKAFEAEVMQGVQPQEIRHFFNGFVGGNELAPGGKIDPVVAGKAMGRTADAHVDPVYAQLTQGFDPAFGRCTANDGILNNNDVFSL